MIIRTRPNNKIIIHCILVTLVIGILIYYIEINTPFLLFLIGFLLLTLLLNRTTYLNLKDGKLIITKTIFLFIPTLQLSIDLNRIDKLTIIDTRNKDDEDVRLYVDFEAGIIVDILTGTYFYKPTFTLFVSLEQNKVTEIEINTQKKDMTKFKKELKKLITANSFDFAVL